MTEIEIESVTVKIKGHAHRLTLEEVQELHQKLGKLLLANPGWPVELSPITPINLAGGLLHTPQPDHIRRATHSDHGRVITHTY